MAEAARHVVDIHDPQGRLELVTSAGYEFLKGKFLLTPPEGFQVVDAASLNDPAVFDDVIARYGLTYGGADRRAVVSMWSLYYLSLMTIGTLVAAHVHQTRIPIAIDQVRVALDRTTALPVSLILPEGNLASMPGAGPDMLRRVMLEHAAPWIDVVARREKLSKRLLWNNMVVYVHWVLNEIGGKIGEELVADTKALLSTPAFADGLRNPLCGLMETNAKTGEPVRRLCCLRHKLPGVPGCGQLCPTGEGLDGL
jgi:ferric iron reductase protein FhuF